MTTGRPAVFLDRDGTVIEEAGYINQIARLRLFPWSLDAMRLLNRAGFRLIVVTNQAGVARGYFDEAFVRRAHGFLDDRFRAAGAEVDGFYHCPHHPDANVAEYRRACECRKPAPGMFLQAARDHGLDLSRSYAIGDRWHDVQAAQRAGATAIMVRTGYGVTELEHPKAGVTPAAVTDTLIDATTWILRQRAS
jgi:D-glycero-D-manno-heptose 1,7-bisphosphate phosphatase